MAEKDKTFLSVRDLYVEYTSNKQVIHAVNGVSFDLKKGKTLGLVGETGAGKTTISKSILQILPIASSKIKSGEIWFEGQDLTKLNNEEMRKVRGNKISMIFQDPMTALNPTMRIGTQIADGIRLHSDLGKKEALQKAEEILELVGISKSRAREYPHQFSGGMKQRVVIAIALACRPELILADEPTTALDVTIQAQVLALINRLKAELNTSMILITHDLSVVAETCDDVAVIYAGEIVESGSIEDIFDNTAHPYTKGLFSSVPDIEEKIDKLTPIPGMMPDPANLPKGCSFNPRCPFATDQCMSEKIEMVQLSDTHYCRCIKAGK